MRIERSCDLAGKNHLSEKNVFFEIEQDSLIMEEDLNEKSDFAHFPSIYYIKNKRGCAVHHDRF